jgi:hypothetical protein
MQQIMVPVGLVLLATTLAGCKDGHAPSGQRSEAAPGSPVAVADPAMGSEAVPEALYTYDDKVAEHRWQVASHPQARLIHGWVSFEESGDEIRIREHVGCGGSLLPIEEPLELSLQWDIRDDKIHLHVGRTWAAKAASFDGVTWCPMASVVSEAVDDYAGLRKDFQVLWRMDISVEEQTVKSIAYLARLCPIQERDVGFNARVMDQVRAAIRTSQG